MYVTDGYQDSEVETQVLPVARQKKEFIERLRMFVIISFAGFDPHLSQNAGGVLSLFFFLIRVIHITKFTPLKCTISGF